MGGIWLRRIELIGTSGELVGHKSGLALTREELTDLVPDRYEDMWSGGSDDSMIRIRSEEFEEIIAEILFRLGNIPTRSIAPPGIRIFHKYKSDKVLRPIMEDVHERFTVFLKRAVERASKRADRKLDPKPFIDEAHRVHGIAGARIAIEIVEELANWMHRNPWTDYRRLEWKDTAELEDLFKSESLETQYGRFLDQRYIDYLYRNFDDIDEINWRKFEGLTAEFFDRSGFIVKIGKGRNDDGIDVRVWPNKAKTYGSGTVLIQCKRENRKIGKVVVKALWADIAAEKAGAGLIVTTTALSPGAKKTCVARGYPIAEADRVTLRQWLQAMRSPYAGVFMGE